MAITAQPVQSAGASKNVQSRSSTLGPGFFGRQEQEWNGISCLETPTSVTYDHEIAEQSRSLHMVYLFFEEFP